MYLSSDNIYQIIHEKDQIIEDLERRLRTMSAVDMSAQKMVFNRDVDHHKSKSFPNSSSDQSPPSPFSSFLRLLGRNKRPLKHSKKTPREENLPVSSMGPASGIYYQKRKISNRYSATSSFLFLPTFASLPHIQENEESINLDCESFISNSTKQKKRLSLGELLCSEKEENIEILLNSGECLKHFGCLKEDFLTMPASQKQELKKRALLLPHQIPSLKAQIK
jgi:hypothetical protein